jgi:hypothetical protein
MTSPFLCKIAQEIDKSIEGEKDIKKKEVLGEQSFEEGPEARPAPTGAIDPVAVMDFFANNDGITDEQFHSFAEQNGFDVDAAEGIAYQLAKRYMEIIRGGAGYGLDPNSVDPQQLEWGMIIESEHSGDPAMQKKITLDHLAENPEYYSDPLFQNELQNEHGGDLGQGAEEGGQEKLSAVRGKGACGKKRKFDGSGKGVGKFKGATMVKTSKARNIGPFLRRVMEQARRQTAPTAKKNIGNIQALLRAGPSKPVGKSFSAIKKLSALNPKSISGMSRVSGKLRSGFQGSKKIFQLASVAPKIIEKI